ncbi:DUF6963 family protein [Microvirga massiliensis]|uniref:DUF6963 family protein n=1 Tax=Microvirga massiliensis TaxID=1033741 RepID=UPI00062B8AAC|nr:hypothetical protein [Microvirga massiliensis]
MTIGIAAFGPNAGQAVFDALRTAELVGHGAIGGFVSLVVIGEDGKLHRGETQRGGTRGLFEGDAVPAHIARARYAALMSSGPDRPSPLSQFTPADARIGLVTGHRLPNTVGAAGIALNEEVLGLMGQGMTPAEAVERVVRENPTSDAGIIALSLDGEVFAEDTAYVARFPDRGQAVLGSVDQGAVVAVLHNAIRPYRSLAALVAETALDRMDPPDAADDTLRLSAGLPIRKGPVNAIQIDETHAVTSLTVSDPKYLAGSWSMGLGPMVPILMDDKVVAHALYEPYLVIASGCLASIDGADALQIPIRHARQ